MHAFIAIPALYASPLSSVRRSVAMDILVVYEYEIDRSIERNESVLVVDHMQEQMHRAEKGSLDVKKMTIDQAHVRM